MRKLIVTQFLTLDGVMEAPEKWNTNYMDDKELTRDIIDDFTNSGALLFGLTTYKFLAARWPSRSGEMADQFNHLPKYVVSTSLQTAEWNNSNIIREDISQAIKQLKSNAGKDIRVWGSHQLVQTLMRENLIDEYKLYVYPVTLGYGKRLFEEGMMGLTLTLAKLHAFSSGVVALVYQGKEWSGNGTSIHPAHFR